MIEPSPENTSLNNAPTRSFSYIPADRYTEFLQRDECQSLRIGLELQKPELIQRKQGIQSTFVVFASARLREPAAARETLQMAEATAARKLNEVSCQQQVALVWRQFNISEYYDMAREFGRLVSSSWQVDRRGDYVIVTGGGLGIMEAANRGAADAHAKSIRLNMTLPHEQQRHPYTTPELSLQFRSFTIRNMHFMIRAKALVDFPGQSATLDELFEILTPLQTGKTASVMVVSVGRDFWERLINRQLLVENGLISQSDLQLFHYAETAQEAWDLIGHHDGVPPS